MHLFFEIAGCVAGAAIYLVQRRRHGDPLADSHRARVLAGAALGSAIGARLLFLLCDPRATLMHLGDPQYLLGGKTVVGGLLGGLVGVELFKKTDGIRRSSGDLFVLPLTAAIAIGRIGCFLYGPADHTAGMPSSLPWSMAIADGIPRHPVALYEILFLVLLLPILLRIPVATSAIGAAPRNREGDRFRIFLTAYLAFRFCVDFLKPDPSPLVLGLSAIQWACLGGLAYYLSVFRRRAIDDHCDAAIPVL